MVAEMNGPYYPQPPAPPAGLPDAVLPPYGQPPGAPMYPPDYPPVAPAGAAPFPPPRRRKVWFGVAAVGVAAVVLLAVVLIFVLSPSSSGSGSQPYSGAEPTASSLARAHGYDVLLEAAGIQPSYSYESDRLSECGGPTTFEFLGASDAGSGTANVWEFIFANASVESDFYVLMQGGSVYDSWIGSCETGEPGASAGVPSDVIGSTQAASIANADGGSTFLTDNPKDSAEYVLLDTTLTDPELEGEATWIVAYLPCIFGSGTQSDLTGEQPSFEVAINASSGLVEEVLPTGEADCGGTSASPVSVGLASSTPASAPCTGDTSPVYFEGISITSTSGPLNTTMFGIRVVSTSGGSYPLTASGTWNLTNDGACPTPGDWVELLNPEGTPLGYWTSEGNGEVWTVESNGDQTLPSYNIASGDTLEVYMVGEGNPAGVAVLELYGLGGYTVSGSADL